VKKSAQKFLTTTETPDTFLHMNEMLDPQNEAHSLAVVTAEELPGYAEWCAEWESEQNQDWAATLCEN